MNDPVRPEQQRDRPLVSVIMPVLNERVTIRKTLGSVLAQETPGFDVEILVIDGKSSDGSCEIVAEVAEANARVRLLVNEAVNTPHAFNLGLEQARGEYVAILGAHARYDRDYLCTCLDELIAHGAVGCTGRTITEPADGSLQARLVAWALSHPFGTSRRSFRTQSAGYVDSAPYPVLVKQPLIDAGGYDEGMLRNQDNDMNQRLRAAGYKLFCTWRTRCFYRAQPTIRSLVKYAFRNGYWVAISLRENRPSMRLRHVAPMLFAVGLGASGTLWCGGRRRPVFVLTGLHLCAGTLAAGQVAARERALGPLWLPWVWLAVHASYGAGTIWGLVTNARKPET